MRYTGEERYADSGYFRPIIWDKKQNHTHATHALLARYCCCYDRLHC